MLETIILAIGAYVGTNLDDLLLDTFFFSSLKGAKEARQAVWGKFLGIGCLLALSFLGAKGLQLLAPETIRWLGLLPIFLGLKAVYDHFRGDGEEERRGIERGAVLGMCLLTLANGSDNIGVYTPLLAALETRDLLLLLGVFAVMILLFCGLARTVAKQPLLQRVLLGKKHIIVPLVYVALGLYILLQ